ncbi:MAG TPA: heparan-alpha-glucosaminide N-acetyltransferase domain-containing protein [Terriglobales bacterium]|nr:heparan-alpha-glucosaminide N-acetyltransferase domain-containing protein [Terriglobales bacterium]
MATNAVASADAPDPMQSAPARIDSVDLYRGLIMAIMALDHTRDFFTHLRFPPEDLSQTWGLLFFTRWITHLCAPAFFFLAGTGVFLSRKRGNELTYFLFTRGLWLMFLEATVVFIGWNFSWSPFALFSYLVITALGASMLFMSGIVRLPMGAIAAFGLGMIFLHNLLDGIKPAALGGKGWIMTLLHSPGFWPFDPKNPQAGGFFVLYALVPWVGVMAAGYALGPVFRKPVEQRRKILMTIGIAALALFAVLRATNIYGNPPGLGFQLSTGTFEVQPTLEKTIIAFFNTEKYPPSLQYLLMTLGPCLIAMSWFDRFDFKSLWGRTLGKWLLVFGRVPMFYYLCHLFVIHAMAIVVGMAFGQPFRWLVSGGFFLSPPPDGYGHNLGFIWLMWLTALVILYFPCRWYANLKQRRKDIKFLSYL